MDICLLFFFFFFKKNTQTTLVWYRIMAYLAWYDNHLVGLSIVPVFHGT